MFYYFNLKGDILSMSDYNAVLARNTENAPQADSYSQTVAFSHYNNLAAQLPLDPKTGELVAGGVKEQALQCFENIKAVVESIDHVMTDVVRLSIFVKNSEDFQVIDDLYKTFFTDYLPTRTVVAVNDLPMNALVQMDALLSNGEGTIPNAPQAGDLVKVENSTENAPVCPFSTQSVAFSHYNNITAQLPLVPGSAKPTVVEGGIQAQTRQCLANIKAILEGMEVPLDDIVKINIFLKDLSDLDAVNEVYTTFFPDSAIARTVAYMPPRSVISVAALPFDARVQIEAVVSHGDGTPPQAVEDRHGIVIKANNTENAPISKLSVQTAAFSHYNHISAQLPVDPKTNAIVGTDVKAQATQCFENLKAIVESINHSLEDVVKVNVFLKNISDLPAFEEAYANFFAEGTPARRVVGVDAISQDALVQIDAVVSNAEGTPPAV